jgi:protein-S-isoprenylcysteine O-methyltransferase Ste14
MYLGFVLVLIGIAILVRSLTPYAIIPIFAVLMDKIFIEVEERMLAEQFGAEWLQYEKKTRRWI